ncbi:uncharacterized protein LOC113558802 [Rhopalosiphum maidis]|uniref:uncharacterized protein LOC113558802 n=1 Tax=Rhopalosiphum maidis TaxID=43146 RepID=UPI000F005F7C|nr:uncharacterized protein LOC113558802 [Rhopalosiphum maidis]
MTTKFHITLRPILILSKSIGLIDITFTVEPSGLLVHNKNSAFHAVLEITRMIVLLICTFLYLHQFDPEIHILQIINTIKFWIIIISARLSTKWIIKFINGIIEFDRNIKQLATNLLTAKRSWSKKQWNMIFISLFLYFIGFKFFFIYIRFRRTQQILSMLHYALFSVPYVMDYAVTITSCFFLQNMYVRFQKLNDIWVCLPADLSVVPGQWTHDKIVDVMENTRLLHSELCELLKAFTLGYGPMLLTFFSSSFINMLLCVYFIIINTDGSNKSAPINGFWLPLMVHVQIITFLLSVIVFVSFINDKRLKIISYLRLYQISNLHMDIKRQIKMFMNQISACNSDQISAFGFFYINLNLVTSILVLLISGIITLIQMKNHPIVLKFNNDTITFLRKL